MQILFISSNTPSQYLRKKIPYICFHPRPPETDSLGKAEIIANNFLFQIFAIQVTSTFIENKNRCEEIVVKIVTVRLLNLLLLNKINGTMYYLAKESISRHINYKTMLVVKLNKNKTSFNSYRRQPGQRSRQRQRSSH